MSDPLTDFIAACRVEIKRVPDAADRVVAIAPLMAKLAAMAAPYLGPEHRRSDPAHYARNAIHIDPSGDLSLFAQVWLPGQWTPVHDHGSWGLVGIVEGVLEERALMSAHDGYHSRRGHRAAAGRHGAAQLWLGQQLRAQPRPHPHDRGAAGPRALHQPAPLWPKHELVPHLRYRRRHPPAYRRAAPRGALSWSALRALAWLSSAWPTRLFGSSPRSSAAARPCTRRRIPSLASAAIRRGWVAPRLELREP